MFVISSAFSLWAVAASVSVAAAPAEGFSIERALANKPTPALLFEISADDLATPLNEGQAIPLRIPQADASRKPQLMIHRHATGTLYGMEAAHSFDQFGAEIRFVPQHRPAGR